MVEPVTHDIGVVPCPAIEHILTQAAIQDIGTRKTRDDIIVVSTRQDVAVRGAQNVHFRPS